jgi:hypothetical protein
MKFEKVVWSNTGTYVIPAERMRKAIEAVRDRMEKRSLFYVTHLNNGIHISLANVMGVVTDMKCDDAGVVTAEMDELDTEGTKEIGALIERSEFTLVLFGNPETYEDLEIKGVVWKEPKAACDNVEVIFKDA